MTNTEDIVMKRVKRIYFLRQYVNRTTLKLYGAGALVGALSGLVSVSNIFANMPSLFAPSSFLVFLLSAVKNTELVVQIVIVSLVFVSLLSIHDIVKNIKQKEPLFAEVKPKYF